MVDEIDQRILGVLTDSGREMTVSEVMDELMAIYGEPYRRCRIRNRLQTLVKFRYCTSREATESIRGKPTRFYGIWRRERMTYYDYPLLFDSKMDLGTFVGTIRKLADADIGLDLETMDGCNDGKIYIEAEGREWDEVKVAIDSIPGVEIDMATMTEWALDCDPLECERMTCIHYKETLTALRGVRLSTRSCAMGILSSNLPEHCEHCSMRTEDAYVRCPICDRTFPSGVDMSYDGDWAMCKDCAKRLKGERMTDEQCPNRPDGLLCACWRGE